MNFYFVFGHPGNLTLFAQIAKIIQNNYPDARTTAIIYEHPYLKNCDIGPFLNGFDAVTMVPFADFHRNIIKGIYKTIRCKQAINKIEIDRQSMIFTLPSMEWPINLILNHIKRRSPESQIVFLDFDSEQNALGKKSISLSLLNWAYAMLFGGSFMWSYVNQTGALMNREYLKELCDLKIYLNIGSGKKPNLLEKPFRLPYPTNALDSAGLEPLGKSVIFFGDTTCFESYPELDRDYFYSQLNNALSTMRRIYLPKNIKLIYKPHPIDNGKLMRELDLSGFEIYKEKITAEMIYGLYKDDIVAVYSAYSFSCSYASQFGIPAYILYEYCWSDKQLIRKMNDFSSHISNSLFKKITQLSDIASIDKMKVTTNINSVEEIWSKAIDRILNDMKQIR